MIADNFQPAKGNNKMSPGAPQTFYPTEAYRNEMVFWQKTFELDYGLDNIIELQLKVNSKPRRKWIAVSGDDDGQAYVLRPASDASDDWRPYEKSLIVNSGGETVGQYHLVIHWFFV